MSTKIIQLARSVEKNPLKTGSRRLALINELWNMFLKADL